MSKFLSRPQLIYITDWMTQMIFTSQWRFAKRNTFNKQRHTHIQKINAPGQVTLNSKLLLLFCFHNS